ncbi:MAG: M1 family aminopeptidase [Thermodesulfobacteriota bacterium]
MMQSENPVKPLHYRIEIEPDMNEYRFAGTLELTLSAAEPVGKVQLNMLDLAIAHCRFFRPDDTWVTCRFAVNPQDETIDIDLPEQVSGEFVLQIEYYGRINNAMAGFYRSRYTHGGKTYPIAVTQFQESDARRAFPCMDHPVYKAAFELSFIVDPRWTVIANTLPASETETRSGKKRVAFQKTPVMSTYLLFFGVGDFHFIIDDLDRRVRAAVLPGMESTTRYGLAFARKALHFCEHYYGIHYPLPKLDLIAVPDFAFGAMENWGAITFRENLILFDPETTDIDGEERICEVIAHEIAHQWFGNLVTPSDWKYLWLNESFATYFGYGVVDAHHRDWQVWDTFLDSQTEPARVRDGLSDTTPIEIPGGSHVVINVSTAPIIYSKGGSILRQIEGFIGTEAFQRGLNQYLNTHAYACADSPHLWDALEAASGKPVSEIMKRWVEQAGHPLITVNRDGKHLTLSQQRFSYLPADDETRWPVPLVIRVWDDNGNSRVIAENFDGGQMSLELDADVAAYKVNDAEVGFYRVAYDDTENFDTLCAMIGRKQLSPIDRWGIQNDRYALLKSGRIALEAYLNDLSPYADEDHPLPLSGIIGNLFQLYLVIGDTVRPRIKTAITDIVKKQLDRIGYTPAAGESHAVARLRNNMLGHAALFEVPGPAEAAEQEFKRLSDGQSVGVNILRAVMQAGAFAGDDKSFDWFIDRFETSPSEHERLNILRAIGCFRQPHLIERAQSMILESVPQRNMFLPVAALVANPHATDRMWDWFVANIEALKQIHPIIFERIVAAIVPVCALDVSNMDRPDAVETYFEDFGKQTDLAAAAIRMSLEKRHIYRRLRSREGN